MLFNSLICRILESRLLMLISVYLIHLLWIIQRLPRLVQEYIYKQNEVFQLGAEGR